MTATEKKPAPKRKAAQGKKQTQPKKTGRPSIKSEKVIKSLLNHLLVGGTVRAWCAVEGNPCRDTVFAWLREDKEFSDRYARAKEEGLEISAFEKMREIADEVEEDNASIQKAKLRIDVLKWELVKKLPKKYGDRVQVEDVTDTSLADRMRKARQREREARGEAGKE